MNLLELYSTFEVANKFGVRTNAIHEWRKKNWISPCFISKHIIYFSANDIANAETLANYRKQGLKLTLDDLKARGEYRGENI